jgi:hypothetical protein
MAQVRTIDQLVAWLVQEQGDVSRELDDARALLAMLGLEPDDLGRSFGALLLESNWATADPEDLPGCVEWMEGMVADDPSAYSAWRSGHLMLNGTVESSACLRPDVVEDENEAEEPYCPLCGESAESLDDLHGHLQNAHRLDPVEAARVVGAHWEEESDQSALPALLDNRISHASSTASTGKSGPYGSEKFSF